MLAPSLVWLNALFFDLCSLPVLVPQICRASEDIILPCGAGQVWNSGLNNHVLSV